MALLASLRDIDRFDITAIASMADSGGSTGRLRDELGILPPGDILKCILALSRRRHAVRSILLKRFGGQGRLSGHNAGNMLIAMLAQYAGSFPEGIEALAEILEVRGRVLPVTTDRATLVAELADGSRIFGEAAIDTPNALNRKAISKVFLVPHHGEGVAVFRPVLQAISRAKYVMIGPGDFYTSIVPNLIVPGVKEALRNTRARVVYILNIMTKFGETHGYSGKDFVRILEKTIGRKADIILANSKKPRRELIEKYRKQRSEFIELGSKGGWGGRRVISEDLLSTAGGILRHDPKKLVEVFVRFK